MKMFEIFVGGCFIILFYMALNAAARAETLEQQLDKAHEEASNLRWSQWADRR
jgi:hypothetical protein